VIAEADGCLGTLRPVLMHYDDSIRSATSQQLPATITMNKTQFLETLQMERAGWESVLKQVGEERFTLSRVVGEWSIKDVIAHIMSYEQYILDRLRETLRGETYLPSLTHDALTDYLNEHDYPDFGSPLLDDDAPNAWVIERYRAESLEAVVRKERQVFAQLLHAINELSEEALAEHAYIERIESNTTEHYQHHANDIRNWLGSSAQ
jgi:hypothetical protein